MIFLRYLDVAFSAGAAGMFLAGRPFLEDEQKQVAIYAAIYMTLNALILMGAH